MSLLCGPAPRGNTSPGIQAKVTTTRERPVALRGNMGTAFRSFMKAIDSLSFDPREFGSLLSQTNIVIQRRFVLILMAYFAILSTRIDNGMGDLMTEEEYSLHMNAHLAYKTLSKFFPE